jgi:hypothetical protein
MTYRKILTIHLNFGDLRLNLREIWSQGVHLLRHVLELLCQLVQQGPPFGLDLIQATDLEQVVRQFFVIQLKLGQSDVDCSSPGIFDSILDDNHVFVLFFILFRVIFKVFNADVLFGLIKTFDRSFIRKLFFRKIRKIRTFF